MRGWKGASPSGSGSANTSANVVPKWPTFFHSQWRLRFCGAEALVHFPPANREPFTLRFGYVVASVQTIATNPLGCRTHS
uniref:Uncharacterized protein n=1 Tax=Trichuris muris TaxID=70415 RepID=A0A5S6QXB3_TRIMR